MTPPSSSYALCLPRLAGLACLLAGVSAPLARGEGLTPVQRHELSRHFGFAPLEVFKLNHGISQLCTADLNTDGLVDVVVSNNAKSTIEVLLQRSAPPEDAPELDGVNDLASDWRFDRKPISVTRAVVCMKIAELTGDTHPDLVFFGDPKELVILPGQGDGSFGDAIVQRVRDGVSLPNCLDVGDLNGDGLTDVVLLAESDVLIFYQRPTGGLAPPRRFAHAQDNVAGIDIADLNGDGRDDLVLATYDDEYPIYVQIQDDSGNLGPVQRVRLPALRSLTFAKCLDRKVADLFAIERMSGRMKRWTFDTDDQDDADPQWAVWYYPLPKSTGGEQLPLAMGDVTGDGLTDLVTVDLDAALLLSFINKSGVGLMPARSDGGQVKMRDMRCFDTDGDGAAELFVLSPDEESVTRSEFRDGRMTFPAALPTLGKPFALEVGRLAKGGEPVIAYVARDKDSKYQLVLQPVTAESLEDPAIRSVELSELDEPPTGLRLADVNRDGREDLLIFVPFGSMLALLQQEDGTFKSLDRASSQSGLVKNATPAGFDFADTDGDGVAEVLLAQKTFVRALRVGETGAWEILDQYNAPGADADITGVAAMPVQGEERPALVMYDNRGRELHYYRPADGGTYALDRSINVGAFDLKAMAAAPLSGDSASAIMLADRKRVAVIVPSKEAMRAHERGVYESSIKDGRLTDVAVGDLNGDNRTDLAVVEVKDHFIEVLTFAPDESVVRATKFRVFSKKQFRQRSDSETEPRWIHVEDVTGDGKDDLLLIAHDRVLLYPGQ